MIRNHRFSKATPSAGAAEILALETMSAMPIEDQAAMAVVPRDGIEFCAWPAG